MLLILSVALLATASVGIFTVRSVDIVGNNLPRDAMAQAAGVTGQNIFAVRSDDVVSRVSAIPSIRVLRVEIAFPDRVVIHASVREPIVGWRRATGISLIDDTGQKVGESSGTQLPIITGGVSPPSRAVVLAVRFAAHFLAETINGIPSGYSQNSSGGLTISGKSGWTAIVGRGSAGLLIRRIATLGALLKELAKTSKQLGTVDLRTQNAVFKLAGT